jgi:hypothetical protein
MTIDVAAVSALDRASVLHPFTQLKDFASGKLGEPTIVETGKGIRIQDATGRSFIDGFAGSTASISAMAGPRWPRRSRVRPIGSPIIIPTPPTRPMSSPSSPTASSGWRRER